MESFRHVKSTVINCTRPGALAIKKRKTSSTWASLIGRTSEKTKIFKKKDFFFSTNGGKDGKTKDSSSDEPQNVHLIVTKSTYTNANQSIVIRGHELMWVSSLACQFIFFLGTRHSW